MTIEANNDTEAMEKMMILAKQHAIEKHPEMMMTDEERMDFIKSNWTKN